ncbi:MAG: hypothetical protein IKH04_05715 [Kiritimatiellae bacterium]|nr:hypothetical protein [Kiritimatiellia bacterium]
MSTTDKNPNINSSGGGFYDIALEPRLLDWPDIAHAAIIELKYLKPGDPEPTPDALAAIKAEAAEQLDRYSADPALAAKWRLKAVEGQRSKAESPTTNLSTFQPLNLSTDGATGSVSLHRLVLVFRGGDCLMAEEI